MSKVNINNEIGTKLKELRIINKVKSKDLASHINKSGSYVTKLEKGEIKQIQSEELENIINFITRNELGFENFIIENKDLMPIELENLAWFANFDKVKRLIPLTTELIKYIKNEMEIIGIDSQKLINYINQNEELTDDFFHKYNLNKKNYKVNIWYPYSQKGDYIENFIIIDASWDKFDSILKGKLNKSNYTFIYTVIYHLLKLKNDLDGKLIDEDLKDQLQKQTENRLKELKFYRIHDKWEMKEKKELNNLLSDFDKLNIELINDLLRSINFISDYDVEYANGKLRKIIKNMDVDAGFAWAFMGLSLEPLKNVEISDKREFLQEVKELIDEYANKPKEKDGIEKY